MLPSPNIPDKDSPMYYAASGVCGELYGFMNIGIGYTLPFKVFGATWLDPKALKERLAGLEGVSFREIWYKPFAGSLKGQLVGGLQFFFTDYEKARITEVQFHIMQAVAELWPEKKAFSVIDGYGLFDKVCGTDYIRKEFSKGYRFDDIKDYWRKDEQAFRDLSQKYYMYL